MDFKSAGTVCGDPSSGQCDAADTCNGSGTCQQNHVADGTNCGDAGTECTNQDKCEGGICVDKGFQPAGTACSFDADACITSQCNDSGDCVAGNPIVITGPGTPCADDT